LLEQSDKQHAGFQSFTFDSSSDSLSLRASFCARTNGSTHLVVDQAEDFAAAADETAAGLVKAVAAQTTPCGGVQWVLALGPYGPRLAAIAAEVGVPTQRVIHPTAASNDAFTSSLVWAWQALERSTDRRRGEQVVVVQAGSGMRVGCALYRL
jgi:hypothetical protein